jgi:hypothetical protein
VFSKVSQSAAYVGIADEDFMILAALGHLTTNVFRQQARRLSGSVSMPAGACRLVLGQMNESGNIVALPLSFRPKNVRSKLKFHERAHFYTATSPSVI